ncbi:jg24680, partial [Pararge aegeria aegeria]
MRTLTNCSVVLVSALAGEVRGTRMCQQFCPEIPVYGSMHLGALGIVMHLSRLVGAAPFSSNDAEWRASRPLVVCSVVLTTLIGKHL